jgi:signal transduction histidine kinase
MSAAADHNRKRRRLYGWRDFVLDRLPYAAAFLIGVLFVAAVLYLDVKQSGVQPQSGSILYLAILAVFALCVWLAYDGLRKRAFYRELNAAAGKLHELDAPLVLHSAATREQKAIGRLLAGLHEAYREELTRIGREQNIRHHFTVRWVHQMKTPLSVIDLLVQESAMQGGAAEPAVRDRNRSILEET